jgi:GTP diphosphokinase / guanosine-3',5'-bis(diphosphate) 3'-diphosphatase
MRSNFARLLKLLRASFPEKELDVVRRAYRRANEAHLGQTRLSGEAYIIHTLKAAQILAQIGLDPIVCAAAVLHDVLEDTPVLKSDLEKEFGKEIADLVEGVTKIRALGFSDEQTTREVKQAQNIRKMLVATSEDVRVILIKLADRLHNMRTIEYLPREKQERIAQETLDIYAPLAHRMGISRWKWELEDHAFHVTQPAEYKEISRQIAMQRRKREQYLYETIEFLEQRLSEGEVAARVIGRPKHLYSIYSKMVEKGKDFAEIMDVLGLRIITQTDAGCYNALGVIHSMWPPLPGRMKDYIAMPKVNGYQAIHTTIMRENGQPMEIQIRSEEMDRTARRGIAAHWVYKEGAHDSRMEERLDWLRQMYEWLKDDSAPDELMDSMRRDFQTSHIYVFTPKGAVKELPSGATPLDFAYLIHSDIGHTCIGVRVNGNMVPFRYHLQMGDVVEILTSKNQTPHLDWIDIVVTGRARTRIRQKLRELGELEPAETPSERGQEKGLRTPRPIRTASVPQVDSNTRKKLIRIEGAKGMEVHFGKCCNPMPGQAVVGYVTKSCSITIHRAECRSFSKSARDTSRIVETSWQGEGVFETTMRVILGPRPNVLADITNALRPMNVDIIKANYVPLDDERGQFDFIFRIHDEREIQLAERALKQVSGVRQVLQLNVSECSLPQAG